MREKDTWNKVVLRELLEGPIEQIRPATNLLTGTRLTALRDASLHVRQDVNVTSRVLHVAVVHDTTGHLKVDWSGRWRPVCCDSRAAVMISTTCNACSGVNRGSLPVARHSATSEAPHCQT